MSRKNRAPKREVLPDPLQFTVDYVLSTRYLDGKRGTTASIVYGAFEQIKTTGNVHLKCLRNNMGLSCCT